MVHAGKEKVMWLGLGYHVLVIVKVRINLEILIWYKTNFKHYLRINVEVLRKIYHKFGV